MLQAAPFDVSGLCPGILRGIGQGLRLIPSDVLHAEVLEDLEELLRAVVERHSTVVRIALLYQHMTVETTHFVDGEHADAAEGAGRDGQHFALRDVGAHHAVRIALQAVERDGAGRDVAFQRAAGEVRIAAGGINDRRRLQYGRGQKIVLAGKPSAGLAPFTSFGSASSAC